jgi:hypothetical protein
VRRVACCIAGRKVSFSVTAFHAASVAGELLPHRTHPRTHRGTNNSIDTQTHEHADKDTDTSAKGSGVGGGGAAERGEMQLCQGVVFRVSGARISGPSVRRRGLGQG